MCRFVAGVPHPAGKNRRVRMRPTAGPDQSSPGRTHFRRVLTRQSGKFGLNTSLRFLDRPVLLSTSHQSRVCRISQSPGETGYVQIRSYVFRNRSRDRQASASISASVD